MGGIPIVRGYRTLLIVSLVTAMAAIPAFAQYQRPGKILGGYFEEWSIYYAGYNIANLQQNGVADKLTHLLYAFANVTAPPSGPAACAFADTYADYQDTLVPSVNGKPYPGPLYGNFAAIQQLDQLHPNLNVLISIGGASAANTAAFSTDASTAAGRQALAASCIRMFIQGNIAPGITAPGLFNGINIDWEFPTASDTQNFTALLQEFRSQLNELSKTTHKRYILSFDGPAGAQNYVNIDLAAAAKEVDFITIDGYNYAGSWDTQTNDASSLFDSPQDPDFGQGLDINSTVNAYLSAGVPPYKYTMGVPLYGAGWAGVPPINDGLYQNSSCAGLSPCPSVVPLANGTGECTGWDSNPPESGCDPLLTPGLATYSTLVNLAKNGFSLFFDPLRVAVWLYQGDMESGSPFAETFYTFDNPSTAAAKMIYVNARGLGGAYVWALKDDDANGTMVKTMARFLGR
jgi:chitinase